MKLRKTLSIAFMMAPVALVSVENREFRINFLRQITKSKDPQVVKSSFYRRVMTTLSCGDCDYIPKVDGAGECFGEAGQRIQLMHNGIKVIDGGYYSAQDPWMTNIIRGLRGHHEPQEERAFYEMLKYVSEDAVMIELGAYWSYYSLWFLHSFPNRRAILVEPMTSRLKVGQRNFELNNERVTSFRHLSVTKRSD